MSNLTNINLKVFFDGKKQKNIIRELRTDVINDIKGYGGDIKNPKPGFSINFDFSKQTLGNHTIKIEVYSQDNRKIEEKISTITIIKKIEYGTEE